jgi:TusE/DsrC/DsvC family sulfur relay protein
MELHGYDMYALAAHGQTIRLDAAGFLVDQNTWNEDVVTLLASGKGIDSFTAKHWGLIRLVRKYFRHHSLLPRLSAVCRITPQARRFVRERFMTFLERAWNIAGLAHQHQDGTHPLGRRDEHHPKEPAAVQEQSPQHA